MHRDDAIIITITDRGAVGNTRPRWSQSHPCEYTGYMCLRLGGASMLTVREARRWKRDSDEISKLFAA